MGEKLPIFEYRDYLQKRYGEVLYRVPIDTGFGCPHRAKDKKGGCSFCPEDGARAVQLGDSKSIEEQIDKGVKFALRRYKATGFMAYLQTFTNTFTSVEKLRSVVEKVLSSSSFRAISFGTRPDCLTPDTIEYFSQLQKRLDVWVELGIQSCNNKTLKRINRGHLWEDSEKAIQDLHRSGINIAAHIILGLPGESENENLATIKNLSQLPIDAIKLHNLHVIKNTQLAEEYQQTPFPLLSEFEYSELLLKLLPHVPEYIPIVRLTTDTPASQLIAPTWSMSKGQFRKYLGAQMRARTISQGCALRDKTAPHPSAKICSANTTPITTDDGSVTFYNEQVKEHYHTLAGAASEAIEKYVKPGRLEELLAKKEVKLLDICFGLGYNSQVSCELAMRLNKSLKITALEMDKGVVTASAAVMKKQQPDKRWQQCLQQLVSDNLWSEGPCSIDMKWGDARYTASKLLKERAVFDLIWLDPFSTQKNSELWTVDFFKILYRLLHPQGALLTYCAAIPVRSGLQEAGFHVGETKPFGRSRGGTIASVDAERILHPLPERDVHLIAGIRGIPYRDPDSTRSNKEILRAREFEILQKKQE